ncbi:MAG TPA: transcription termination factor NusA [Spirochaetota bacterium]|nr:transcription termination factor NusA [Spirochaetota bacterium]
MGSNFADAVRQLIHEKGIPSELVYGAVEKGLTAAYKRKYQTDENVVVRFDDETGDILMFARKEIVEEIDNPVFDIDLESARALETEADIGDEILVSLPVDEFSRIAAQSARQIISQELRKIERNIIYNEYIHRKGEIINGYVQREKNGMYFINLGKTEGIMPRSHQSPREKFQIGERIKAYLYSVEEDDRGTRIVLSRGCPEFVRHLFEVEVPEVYDNIVQIKGIVREAGYRTKVAVYSSDGAIDPIGTCVGVKGVRIQTIIREINGEKIDILRYSHDTREFIRNAMSPVKELRVFLLSEARKEALVVVPDREDDTQFSLAIGKNGLNVKLASKLTGWNIDVRKESEMEGVEIVEESMQRAHSLFRNDGEEELDEAAYEEEEIWDEGAVEEDEGTPLDEIEDFDNDIIGTLEQNGVRTVEQLVELGRDELLAMEGIDEALADTILRIMQESVTYLDDGEEENIAEGDVVYECTHCGHKVRSGMKTCPNCGSVLAF